MKNNIFALYFTFIAYETPWLEFDLIQNTDRLYKQRKKHIQRKQISTAIQFFSAFEPKAQVSLSDKILKSRNHHCRFRCRELFGFCLLLQNHMSISTNFAQSTLGLREFKWVRKKDHVLFQGSWIGNNEKYYIMTFQGRVGHKCGGTG